MNTYSYCDISIESEIDLPSLSASTADAPDVYFRVDYSGHLPVFDGSWQQADLGEGGFVSCAAKPGTDLHCLIFENIAIFEIRNGFSEIICHPVPATTLNSIHHLLLDQVLPRVLSARGKLMMHGSCIEHPKGVIVFAGVSGAGKSTLAAHFSRRGFPILSDDGLQMIQEAEKITVIPAYPGLRLWEDSVDELFENPPSSEPMAHYSSKKRIDFEVDAVCGEKPALGLFFLHPQPFGWQLTISKIAKREAFFELNKQVFILDPFSQEKAIARTKSIADLVSKLPLYTLNIPHDYSLLDQVQKKVMDLVETF